MAAVFYRSLLLTCALRVLPSVAAQCDVNDASCQAEWGKRSGSAMLQTENIIMKPQLIEASERSTSNYLDNDVQLLESEMTALEAKVVKLEEAVQGKTEAALLEEHQNSEDPVGLKGRVAALESTASDLKSRMESLESTVYGSAAASLISSETHGAADTLNSRVAALKSLSADLQARATKLEHSVTGSSSLAQAEWGWSNDAASGDSQETGSTSSDAMSKTKVEYMVNDVEQLEKEMATLKDKTAALEANIGSGGAALVSTKKEPTGLVPRVKVLEADAEDVKGRVEKLEVSIRGGGTASAPSIESTEGTEDTDDAEVPTVTESTEGTVLLSREDGLKARIKQLQALVSNLKGRVSSLEHQVQGSSLLHKVPKAIPAAEEFSMSKEGSEYMVNDVEQLEKEMATLKEKTASLEASIGSGGAALVSTKKEPTGVVTRVKVLETDAEDVKGRVEKLEVSIRGGGTASAPSIESTESTEGTEETEVPTVTEGTEGTVLLSREDGLEARIKQLQALVSNLKGRVSSLEHQVQGSSLLHKVPKAIPAEEFRTSNQGATFAAKKKFLVGDADQMIKEVEDLKTRVAALEASIGAATSAESLLDSGRKKGDDLATKVETLEADTTDLKSRVEALENTVHGSVSASLAFVTKDDGLEARVGELQKTVTDLTQRVTSLEHLVTGL